MIEELAKLLTERNITLATAESCTGGLLGNTITDVPGASKYYLGGIIAYSNEIKIKLLKVKKGTIERYGAVSEQCAREMVLGVAKLFNAHMAISTTGIAGPGGGTADKPVGTVFIGIYSQGTTKIYKHKFSGTRREIKEKIVNSAINHAIQKIKN